MERSVEGDGTGRGQEEGSDHEGRREKEEGLGGVDAPTGDVVAEWRPKDEESSCWTCGTKMPGGRRPA